MRDTIKILGMYYSAHEEASKLEQNWKGKIENILRTIRQWENRNPSLYGKILLTKTIYFYINSLTYYKC